MYALMLVLCLAVSLQQTPNKGNRIPHSDSTQKKSVTPKQSFGASNFVYQPTIERAEQQYDPYADRLYRAYLRATIIAAVFSFIVIVILVWQNFLTRKVANAAQASAKAATLNATALMGIERCWLTAKKGQHYTYGDKTVLDLTFTNTGNTPAFVNDIDAVFSRIAKISDLPDEPIYETDTELQASPVWLNKGGEFKIELRYKEGQVLPEDWRKIKTGELTLYISARAKYHDVFERPHEIRICYAFDYRTNAFVTKIGGPKYNVDT